MNFNKKIGVVCVQMHVTDCKLTNIKHAERLIRIAVEKYQPKLVVLPEYFNTLIGKKFFELCAETFPTGETFCTLKRLAEELRIYLVCGSMPEIDTTTMTTTTMTTKTVLFNTTVVFAPTGKLIAKYRKIHLLDMLVEKKFTNTVLDTVGISIEDKIVDTDYYKLCETDYIKAGKELAFFEIDGIKIGLGIGYDICFGELCRLYKMQGCKMVIFPTVMPTTFGYAKLEKLLCARAIENQIFVLGVSQAFNDVECIDRLVNVGDKMVLRNRVIDATIDMKTFGCSLLVDFCGHVITRAGDDEELLYALVDFTRLDMYNMKYDMFAHKRNDVYDVLYKF